MLTEPVDETAPALVKRRHRSVRNASQEWFAHPSIQGIGIGHKVTAGRRSRTLLLKVFVDTKRHKTDV